MRYPHEPFHPHGRIQKAESQYPRSSPASMVSRIASRTSWSAPSSSAFVTSVDCYFAVAKWNLRVSHQMTLPLLSETFDRKSLLSMHHGSPMLKKSCGASSGPLTLVNT